MKRKETDKSADKSGDLQRKKVIRKHTKSESETAEKAETAGPLLQEEIASHNSEDQMKKMQLHETKKPPFEKHGKKPNVAKKPDWVKYKEKRKVVTLERKKKKSLFEIGNKAKGLWEQLRRKNCPDVKKMELLKELHGLLQGNYAQAVFSHDVGRVVQWLLKIGTKEIRESIAMELKGHLVEMCMSKYGCFCVKQLLKRGSKQIRTLVIETFMGNVVKLLNHRISSPVISSIYSTYANSKQKCHLRQEFYCDIYRVMKSDEIKSLKLAIETSPELKDAILNTTKANLLKVINKELVESQVVNTVLGEYISSCNESDRSEIITTINSILPLMTKTKEGAKVGLMCLWHGTQKDRKLVIKSLKGSVAQIAVCEHGYLVLPSLFDCVDDTVLVRKAIISEILSNVLVIAKNKFGRRVILYLITPRDPAYFHPDIVELLKSGDDNPHSKKSVTVRRSELLSSVIEPLLDSISKQVKEWFTDNSIGMVALAALKAGKGPKLRDAFEALALYVNEEKETKVGEEKVSVIGMEDAGIHVIMKKLILFDKLRYQENSEDVLFSEIFVSGLNAEMLLRVLTSNRGCFILVKLLEAGIPKVKEMLKAKLKGSVATKITELTSKGGEFLKMKMKE